MRPSAKPTGAIWRLLKAWSDGHPLRPNQTQMAGLFGVSDGLLSEWKYRQATMQPDDMAVVARETGISPADLAAALQEDMPFIVEHHAARRNKSRPPSSI